MAEGRSNAAIAQRLVVSERAVAKHTASIFNKLGLEPSADDNRRVLAVSPTWAVDPPGRCQPRFRDPRFAVSRAAAGVVSRLGGRQAARACHARTYGDEPRRIRSAPGAAS